MGKWESVCWSVDDHLCACLCLPLSLLMVVYVSLLLRVAGIMIDSTKYSSICTSVYESTYLWMERRTCYLYVLCDMVYIYIPLIEERV